MRSDPARTLAIALAVLAAGCCTTLGAEVKRQVAQGQWNRSGYQVLPSTQPPDVIARPVPGSGLCGYEYLFIREPSPVTVPLRGVEIHPNADTVVAVGDQGVILTRGRSTAWKRVPSGTTERLNGVRSQVIVGDHGTVLTISGDETRQVPTGARENLYAVTGRWPRYVVGEGGLLMRWSLPDGPLERIPTHTPETLRSIVQDNGDLYLAGAHGALVHCALAGDSPVCGPVSLPTKADLVVVDDARGNLLVLSSRGEVYVMEAERSSGWSWSWMSGAPLAALAPPAAAFMHLPALHLRHQEPDPVAVGPGGQVAFLAPDRRRDAVTLRGAPDLSDVAAGLSDIFAVGADGTIVHGVAPGVDFSNAVEP